VAEQMLNDYLNRARNLADGDRFDEALATLHEAYKLPSITKDDQAQIEAVEQNIKEQRQQRVRSLTDELEALLTRDITTLIKGPEGQAKLRADVEQGETTLVQASVNLFLVSVPACQWCRSIESVLPFRYDEQ